MKKYRYKGGGCMFWYLLNICIVVITWLLPINVQKFIGEDQNSTNIKIQQYKNKRTCIVGTVNWILLSGLRAWEIGADTYAYKIYMFDKTMNRTWDALLGDYMLRYVGNVDVIEPTYTLIEKVFQIFSTNYQGFLMFIAILFFVPLGILIYKYSKNSCLSFVLFSCLFYSFFAITGHRQTIATAIAVLMGVELIKRKKLIPFILVILLATTIHASAICFLPFYWISKIRFNKITLIVYWMAILLSFINRGQFLALLQRVVGYEQYQEVEGAGAGTFIFLLMVVAVVATLFYKIILNKGNSMTNIAMNALFIACIFSSFLLINQSLMRVVQYYSIFLLLLIPEFKNIFVNRKETALYELGASIVLVILLISNQPIYEFCFM